MDWARRGSASSELAMLKEVARNLTLTRTDTGGLPGKRRTLFPPPGSRAVPRPPEAPPRPSRMQPACWSAPLRRALLTIVQRHRFVLVFGVLAGLALSALLAADTSATAEPPAANP